MKHVTEDFAKDFRKNQQRQQAKEMLANRKQRTNTKIGRNEPCPCNSGKKYKKCCLI